MRYKYKVKAYTGDRIHKRFEVDAESYREAEWKSWQLLKKELPDYQTKISSVVITLTDETVDGI